MWVLKEKWLLIEMQGEARAILSNRWSTTWVMIFFYCWENELEDGITKSWRSVWALPQKSGWEMKMVQKNLAKVQLEKRRWAWDVPVGRISKGREEKRNRDLHPVSALVNLVKSDTKYWGGWQQDSGGQQLKSKFRETWDTKKLRRVINSGKFQLTQCLSAGKERRKEWEQFCSETCDSVYCSISLFYFSLTLDGGHSRLCPSSSQP